MVGRRMSPSPRDLRPIPPAREYAPTYPDRERMKREFRKPSPEMRRRSRSMSPPPKKRHPPSPGPSYRGSSPSMRRRRSFSPPPPMRRSRSRSPRKQRAGSPRGPRASPPRGSHRVGTEARESRRNNDPHPNDFCGPWGTRIAVHDLRKITVDIKRNLPKGKRSSSPIIRRIINADDITIYRRNGEGSRPMLDRPELRGFVNRRFDGAAATPNPNEPRVVAIIREPGQDTDGHQERSSFEHHSRSRERGYTPPTGRHSAAPVGDRIDRDRSERTQRQVEKLEQMEVAIDRKLEQIQRYERKYEETMRNEKYGDGKDERKMVDRSVRDRLGPKRDRDFDDGHAERLPDFSQRPDKPPLWDDEVSMRHHFYGHENRTNGFRGRGGRGSFRPRGRGGPRGRGRFSPTPWQHDKYEAY